MAVISPQEMVEDKVRREFRDHGGFEVQALGNGIFTATIYAAGGSDEELQIAAMQLYRIEAVPHGDPVTFPEAGDVA